MSLVHQDQVEGAQLAGALVDRLDAGQDDRPAGVPALQASRVDAEADLGADLAQFVRRLFQQLLDVGQDQHPAVPARHRVLADGRHDRRLAAGGRDDDDRVIVVRAQVGVDGMLSCFLIGAQCQHAPSCPGGPK